MQATARSRRSRTLAALLFGVMVIPAFAGATFANSGAGVGTGSQADVAAVRQATNKYRDLSAALADNYVLFYTCTEQPGVGTMGQHYVNMGLAGTPGVDPLHPEALVYEPQRNGDMKLVAVEYVTFDTSSQPSVLGQPMLFRPSGNRYGLPDFYERHAWLWQGNSRGLFDDWNPSITCLGTGDNGG
jgi:hypothetical protein